MFLAVINSRRFIVQFSSNHGLLFFLCVLFSFGFIFLDITAETSACNNAEKSCTYFSVLSCWKFEVNSLIIFSFVLKFCNKISDFSTSQIVFISVSSFSRCGAGRFVGKTIDSGA